MPTTHPMFKYKNYVLEPGNQYLNPCLNYPHPKPQFHGPADNSEYSILAYFSLMKEQKEVDINICFPQVPMTKFTFFLLKSNILQNLGGTTNLNQEKPRQALSIV